MCPLPSEMYTSPYYRDIMAAPMGNPFMYGGLGYGMGLYGGMYPMCGMYGGYIPPQFYGLRMNNRTLSQDTYVPQKDVNKENNNQIKKFLKILGLAVGTVFAAGFLKGKIKTLRIPKP